MKARRILNDMSRRGTNLKSLLSLIPLAFVAGCSMIGVRQPNSVYLIDTAYPATVTDCRLIAESLRDPRRSERDVTERCPWPVGVCIGFFYVLDTPFSLVSDTVCLPWDVYRLSVISACSASVAKQDAPAAQQKAAKTLGIPVEKTLPKSGIVLRLIPAGSFVMGSPKSEKDRCEDEAQHKVTLTNTFYMGKYEVTQGQWKQLMGRNPSCLTNSGDNAPVDNVGWHDCTNFMERLAALEGMPKHSFRLPTEAEWEYACRASTTTVFCYGDAPDKSMSNCRIVHGCDILERTLPVGQFKPNAWGLYDMHGNVSEWCANWYYCYQWHEVSPTGPAQGLNHVVRGGCWWISVDFQRSAERDVVEPNYKSYMTGFRLCMPVGD